jgi:hypothetical protein
VRTRPVGPETHINCIATSSAGIRWNQWSRVDHYIVFEQPFAYKSAEYE